MAKQVIVLEVNDNDGYIKINTVFWFPVTGTPIPRTNATSAYKNASSAELSALTSGTTVEENNTFTFQHGADANSVKAALVALYQQRAAAIASLAPNNAFYGLTFDSVSGWSA